MHTSEPLAAAAVSVRLRRFWFGEVLAKLHAFMPATVPAAALDALKLVGVSRRRLWFAAPNPETMAALGKVPGGVGFGRRDLDV